MGQIDLSTKPSFIADVDQDTVDKYKLLDGDLVVTLTGTRKKRDYGWIAVIRNSDCLLLNQRIARLRVASGVIPAYLQVAMQSEHYRNRFFSHETGNVGQGNVGMRAVIQEGVLLPALSEQQRIVAEVERRLSVIEEVDAIAAVNLQRANRLRQSILQSAFHGDLRTNDY